MTRRAVVGSGLLVAGAFFLMQLAWLVTIPAAAGIDEFDHIHRAASVASGHWGYGGDAVTRKSGRGWLIPVRADIVAATTPGCASFQYVGPANCNASGDAGHGLVLVACAAARYNPLFYAAIGYPSLLFHGASALVAMRLVAAALSAGMLGLAAVAVRSWARTGWPMLGLFMAATPTVIYSSSIAAPNGLNIVSGLTLWAGLLGLAQGPDDDRTRRRLLWISAVAAATLVNTHTLGIVWLLLIVLAVAVQRGSRAMMRLPRNQLRQTRVCATIVLAGLVLAAGWILAARTNDPSSEGTVFHQSWWHQVITVGLPLWPLQAIAAFPMRDEPAPTIVYAIGITMMLAVATKAVILLARSRSWKPLLTIAFVALTSYAVPLALTAVSFHYIGLAWQGRYEMPFTGGLLLLFTLALDQARTRLRMRLAVVALGLMALMNLLGQLRVAGRFDGSRLAAATGWAAPSLLLLGLLAVGFTVLGSLGVLASARREDTSMSSDAAKSDGTGTSQRIEASVA